MFWFCFFRKSPFSAYSQIHRPAYQWKGKLYVTGKLPFTAHYSQTTQHFQCIAPAVTSAASSQVLMRGNPDTSTLDSCSRCAPARLLSSDPEGSDTQTSGFPNTKHSLHIMGLAALDNEIILLVSDTNGYCSCTGYHRPIVQLLQSHARASMYTCACVDVHTRVRRCTHAHTQVPTLTDVPNGSCRVK